MEWHICFKALLFELNLQEVFDPGFQTILSSERFGSRDFLIGELMYNALFNFPGKEKNAKVGLMKFPLPSEGEGGVRGYNK